MKALALILILCCSTGAFDLPENDSWYFQSDRMGLSFMVPDKFSHFVGSQLLAEKIGAIPAFVAGLSYELYQQSIGVGFSPRDLAADALGVLATILPTGVALGCVYSKADKIIMLKIAVRI